MPGPEPGFFMEIRMSDHEMRVECLKLAVQTGGTPEQIVTLAARLLAFVRGDIQDSSQR